MTRLQDTRVSMTNPHLNILNTQGPSEQVKVLRRQLVGVTKQTQPSGSQPRPLVRIN